MKAVQNLRFSVVIPCYNEEDYIGNALLALQAQNTETRYEVIIVDNNCTDATSTIAKKLGARVVYERAPGVCAARQAGTTMARGEIIVSTDADTVFPTNWLQNIDKAFLSDSSLVAIGGPCRYYDGPWWGKIYTHFLFGWSYMYLRLTGHPFYLTATNIAFKKAAWKGYDLSLTQGGDELGLLHQLRTAGKVGFTPKNTTYTSGRRLEKGMFYNIFISFLYYYIVGYHINTIFKKPIIGSAPAFRKSHSVNIMSSIGAGITLIFVIGLPLYVFANFITDSSKDLVAFVNRLF
jgi:glycosyltransferase involved in cell wall biosynthesis